LLDDEKKYATRRDTKMTLIVDVSVISMQKTIIRHDILGVH